MSLTASHSGAQGMPVVNGKCEHFCSPYLHVKLHPLFPDFDRYGHFCGVGEVFQEGDYSDCRPDCLPHDAAGPECKPAMDLLADRTEAHRVAAQAVLVANDALKELESAFEHGEPCDRQLTQEAIAGPRMMVDFAMVPPKAGMYIDGRISILDGAVYEAEALIELTREHFKAHLMGSIFGIARAEFDALVKFDLTHIQVKGKFELGDIGSKIVTGIVKLIREFYQAAVAIIDETVKLIEKAQHNLDRGLSSVQNKICGWVDTELGALAGAICNEFMDAIMKVLRD
eukprot:SAG31_NODE_12132_length_965_cov_1.070439_1_plen_284_part_10